MKKFTLALATLALSVASMNATDYYLIGGPLGWTEGNPEGKFTPTTESGVYELKLEKLTSGFKINDGTWTNPDVNFGSNGEKLVVDVPYHYGVGGSTSDIIIDGQVMNPTLVLNINSSLKNGI